MDFALRINPASVIMFAAIGVWVYFYSKDKPWLLRRWLRRTPAALGIACALLPFPFLFVFLWDFYRHIRRMNEEVNTPPPVTNAR
jgi:hypothetical protein